MLGTAAWDDAATERDAIVVDVRDLVDKGGNSPDDVRRKIDEIVSGLTAGRRVIVACDYGMSRSNAVAAGALARVGRIDFDAALTKVLTTTGETSIKLEMVEVVRQ